MSRPDAYRTQTFSCLSHLAPRSLSAGAADSLRRGMQIAGRRALLTGATGGLGRAIAEALAERGATLLLSARKRGALEEMAAGLPGAGHEVLPADLAEPGAAEELAAAAGEVD